MDSVTITPIGAAEKAPHQIALLAVVLSLLCTVRAVACPGGNFGDGIVIDDFLRASLVLVGDISGIETIDGTNSVLVTVRVTERLHGDIQDEVTLLWPAHPEASGPIAWTEGPHVLVAADLPQIDGSRSLYFGEDNPRPDLPAIAVVDCRDAGMFPATDARVDKIRSAISARFYRRAALIGALVLLVVTFGVLVIRSAKRQSHRDIPDNDHSPGG